MDRPDAPVHVFHDSPGRRYSTDPDSEYSIRTDHDPTRDNEASSRHRPHLSAFPDRQEAQTGSFGQPALFALPSKKAVSGNDEKRPGNGCTRPSTLPEPLYILQYKHALLCGRRQGRLPESCAAPAVFSSTSSAILCHIYSSSCWRTAGLLFDHQLCRSIDSGIIAQCCKDKFCIPASLECIL